MKTKTKRLFAVILSAAVALSSTALAALAESTATPSEAETGPVQTEETTPPVSGDQQEDALPQEGMQETATEVTAPVELPVVQPSGEDGETPEPDAADQEENETELPGQEDGPKQPTVSEGEDVQPEETAQPVEQPASVYESAYAYVAAGTILYADAQRTVRLGTLAAETALRAKNVGDYEHGSVYEVLFDTYKTAGTERWETAYFYTSDIRRLTEAQSEALVGVRTVNGAKVVYADFYYYNEENVPEDGGEHEEEAEEVSGAHTNTNSVNLRRDAKKSADMIAQLRKGTPVTIIEAVANSAGETWYKVRCEAGTGYILASLIDGAGSIAVAGKDEETDATGEETAEPEEAVEPEE
ncbi:MAG: SH3 domain-containing protein, partial [Clostridia bacterium]|nr:SH3 domain-containing protein [Clostridia bacterium]